MNQKGFVQLRTFVFTVVATAVGLLPLACSSGDPNDPQVVDLRTEVDASNCRTAYARAPGWASRLPSDRVHAPSADIYINSVVKDAFCNNATLSAWPDGSLLIKDGYDGESLKIVAAMRKTAGVWAFSEWDGAGDFVASGSTCSGCHSAGADSVLAFKFPQTDTNKAAYCK